MSATVVVCGTDSERAAALAARLGLVLVAPGAPTGAADLALRVDGGRISLARLGAGAAGPVAVDFEGAAAARRTRGRDGGRPLIARALGLDRGLRTVVDATAGLGRDAFTLAACGARVTMLERHPLLVVLLEDGLERARRAQVEAVTRLELVQADAVAHLRALEGRPDAVFVDPMFPDRGKSALPGRDLQVLRALLGPGGDEVEELLAVARAVARRRVVVKRPAHARPVGGRPDATYEGGRVRYDLYAPR